MTGLHEEIRNFDAFQNSTRRFTNFTKRIGGASDIDCFIERNHCFMFLEGKPLIENDTVIRMPWGQYTALLRLAQSSDKNKVYIIGEGSDGAPKMICNILLAPAKEYHDEQSNRWMVDLSARMFYSIDVAKLESFVFQSYKLFEESRYDRESWWRHEANSLYQ